MLPEGSHFNHNEQVFVWETEEGTQLYFDNQETVRFRIDSEQWNDQAPLGPEKQDDSEESRVIEAPYKIVASMEEVGLGPCLWWD
ncbi:hypothetical protein ACHAO8_000240 [Botrytis cinerea]